MTWFVNILLLLLSVLAFSIAYFDLGHFSSIAPAYAWYFLGTVLLALVPIVIIINSTRSKDK